MKKQAFNPYLPSWEYIPDGEPHVFGERLYVFGSHDRFNGTLFCQNDYVCWSAPLDDLGDWRFEGTIYRKAQDPLAKEDSIMQAPDVCQGPDGRFYLYYTLGLVPVMAVAVCDTPAGQYQYYGLVQYDDGTPVGTREHDLFQFDPGAFRDDDDRVYLYSGFGPEEDGMFAAACQKYRMNGAYVMELEPDMRTVKGTPRRIVPKNGLAAGTGFEGHGFFEASSMRKIGGRYYFVYSSGLSHELCWAVSDRPDGEFQYGGTLVSIGDIGLTDQPRNYLGNTHGGLVELNGNWYIFYHRQTNRQQYSRQGCAERVELDENGRFHQAQITSCGLNGGPLRGTGCYEARIACNLWSKNGAMAYGHLNTPEAENHPYFTQTGEDREENEDQYIANMRDGAVAGFKFFDLQGLSEIAVDASDADGEFWVHTDLEDAPICKIPLHMGMKRASFPPCFWRKAAVLRLPWERAYRLLHISDWRLNMNAVKIVLNADRDVSLTAYIQEVEGEFGFAKRPAMLVLPGGGYAMCSDREADPVALAYAKAGYQIFILRYTVTGKGLWPLPLEDYEQAMELIEQNAEEWHVDTDKIAVSGFSAGGHLAACAATMAKHKPAAAVLVYPAILKEILDMCQPRLPEPWKAVDEGTAPCFLAAARDDRVVNIKNTLQFELALADNGIPFESHIYSYGGHGFSTAENWINTNSVSERTPNWVADSIGWLKETLGELTRSGFTQPNLAVSKNGDTAPVLTVNCSLAHLRRQSPQAQDALAPMYAGIKAVAEQRGYPVEGLMGAVGGSTAREIMEMVGVPQETILKIDAVLHGIVNQLD